MANSACLDSAPSLHEVWLAISGTQEQKWCCRETSANRAQELSAESLALQERVDALRIVIAERMEENNGLQEQVSSLYFGALVSFDKVELFAMDYEHGQESGLCMTVGGQKVHRTP